MALPVTYTVLQPAVVQGTVYSSPQAWEPGAKHITLVGILNDTDIADPTKNLSICLETSTDGGVTFPNSGPKAGWVGNPNPGLGGTLTPPMIGTGYSISNSPPTHVRIRFDIGQGIDLSLGGAVTFNP